MSKSNTVTVTDAGKVTDIDVSTGITFSGSTYQVSIEVISVSLYASNKYPGIELKISGNKTLLIKQL